MPLTTTDKVKINKYIRENKMGEIYYLEMCDVIGKRDKISHMEFLEHFTECVLAEFRKNTKISVKHVAKLVKTVDTFLGWINDEGKEVTDNILDKIRSFEEFYQEYSVRTNYEIDSELTDEYIKPLMELVNEQLSCSKQSESVSKYINQISELETQIKSLKKELESLQKQFDKQQKLISQKQERIEIIGNSLTNITNESNNKSIEIEKLEKEIKDFVSTISELEEELKLKVASLEETNRNNEDLNNEVLKLKEELESLMIELKSLQKIVKEEEKKKKQHEKLVVKENELEALIYESLLIKNQSIEDLVLIAANEGITTDANQILEILRRIKKQINVVPGNFSLKPTYKIAAPHIFETGKFAIELPYSSKYYDIMLVSDFHITEFDTRTISYFDKLNEYCTKNGINLILNLGDFFEGFGGKTADYENAVKNYKNIEDGIKMIPKAEGLYHAILGGNHDRNIIGCGYDPIKLLTDAREDLINLGYSHSTISINNPEQSLGEFDIHHPDTFDFPISLDEDGIDIEKISNYLANIYAKNNRYREDSYIDIFGHTHKSQFNSSDSYCFIPSYFRGHARKGAMHLRVYFDEDKSIKYMVFMPLNFNTGLVKNNEIVYQKKLKK